MNLVPMGSQLIIKPIISEKKTDSGLILLKDDATLSRGEVVASGPGRVEYGQLVPNTLKVGDIVVFHKNAQYPETEIGGQKYLLIIEQAILAKEVN
jgi:chaperonin GroES